MLIELQKEISKVLADTLVNLYQLNELMSNVEPNEETTVRPCNILEEARDNLNLTKEVYTQVMILKDSIGGKTNV